MLLNHVGGVYDVEDELAAFVEELELPIAVVWSPPLLPVRVSIVAKRTTHFQRTPKKLDALYFVLASRRRSGSANNSLRWRTTEKENCVTLLDKNSIEILNTQCIHCRSSSSKQGCR
jgi:hypothetical protein